MTLTIKAVPVPHFVQWSIKENNSATFQPINVNAVEYKGTSESFPHPMLVLKHRGILENCSIKIEVHNRIGEVNKRIPGNHDVFKEIYYINVYIFTAPHVSQKCYNY